jgi:IrrE N-terminal-like domain/N-terminal domain of anti-restriction factor ArdC
MSTATLPQDARVAEAHALLVDQLRALTSSEQWLSMLEMSRRFHTYSARNVLLLMVQGAHGRVAGYRTWQTIPAEAGGNCQVRKGAKAMTILAPVTRSIEHKDEVTSETTSRRALVGFKAVRVFDETALVSPPAPAEVVPQLLTGNTAEHLYDTLAGQVREAGFRLEDGDCSPANGRTDWRTRIVTVRPDLEPSQRTKTLAHELGHVCLHDPQRSPETRMSRERMEVEAESVAYLVCAHAGIDSATYTVPYVAHWSAGNVELVQQTAERVIDAARNITDGIDHALSPARAPAPAPIPLPVRREAGGDAETNARAQHPSSKGRVADRDLSDTRRRVEADAAVLIGRLAANPDEWAADPEIRDVVRRLAAREMAPSTRRVAAARERLAEVIHHPAAPEPRDLIPSTTPE